MHEEQVNQNLDQTVAAAQGNGDHGDTLLACLHALENRVDALTDESGELARKLESVSMLPDVVNSLRDIVANSNGRIEELNVTSTLQAQCRQQIHDQGGRISSLEDRILDLDQLLNSLLVLVWWLDKGHRKTKGFVDLIGPDTSPKRLEEVRDVLRAVPSRRLFRRSS